MPITRLRDRADLDALLAASDDAPVLLFKHSTRCGVSSYAHDELERFAGGSGAAARIAVLHVVEDRTLSAEVARLLGVAHESPQAIVIRRREVKWHASHGQVTEPSLARAVAAAG